tara:strand:- start:175 stop:828 length:654 start_codon:yes stop_codon:yes gene_type:complete
MYNSVVIELVSNNVSDINKQLTDTKRQAPKLFENQATILDFSKLEATTDMPSLETFKTMLGNNGFSLIGIHAPPTQIESENRNNAVKLHVFNQLIKKQAATQKTQPKTAHQAYIHCGPVRSGQQIVKKHQDVIIFGNVSPGSEVLSGGHIIVHGALNGKAFAGINGNEMSEIISMPSRPELISIASRYLKAPSRTQTTNQYVRFTLCSDNIVIEQII